MKFIKFAVIGSLLAACSGQDVGIDQEGVLSVEIDAGVEALGVIEQALTSRQGSKRQFGAQQTVGNPFCQVDVTEQTCIVPSKNQLEFAVISSQWTDTEKAQFVVAVDTLSTNLFNWKFRVVENGSARDSSYLRVEVKTGNTADQNNRFDVEDFHTVTMSTLDVTEGQNGRMPSGDYRRHVGGTCTIDRTRLRLKVLDEMDYSNPVSAYHWWIRHVFGNCATAFIGLGSNVNGVTRSYSQMLPPPVTDWRFPFATTNQERCLANGFNPAGIGDYSLVSYICN